MTNAYDYVRHYSQQKKKKKTYKKKDKQNHVCCCYHEVNPERVLLLCMQTGMAMHCYHMHTSIQGTKTDSHVIQCNTQHTYIFIFAAVVVVVCFFPSRSPFVSNSLCIKIQCIYCKIVCYFYVMFLCCCFVCFHN